MCGRCASTRNPHGVRHACAYRPKGSKRVVKPAWVSCSSQKYYPSYNMSPQTNAPVLLSPCHTHVKKVAVSTAEWEEEGDRVLQTMKWGLIPSWHRGEPSTFPTLLNNCRAEGMMEKASFRNAVQKGQRCVVLADGFFEWYRGGGQKQPYFVYFSNKEPTEEMRELTATEGAEPAEGAVKEESGCEVKLTGRMLTMAGLFDIWRAGADEEPLFTYTVITVDSHPHFTHIHHRMPAILDGEHAIRTWLDPSLATHQVVKLLQPSDSLKWHPVSSVVNNVRNKTPECILEIDPRKQVNSKQNTLLKWFSKSPKKSTTVKKRTAEGEEEIVATQKKPKLESEP